MFQQRRNLAKLKFVNLSRLKTHQSDKGHKTRQYAVAICNNTYIKVELNSINKPVDINKVYIVTNYLEDGDNIRLHINSGINRSYGDRTTSTPGTAVPDIANGLGVLLTVDTEKSTEKRMSAIGTIVSVSTLT